MIPTFYSHIIWSKILGSGTYAPTTGEVRLLFFTDRQWGMSKIVSRIPKELEKVPEQVEFFSELMENEKNEKLDENNNFFVV